LSPEEEESKAAGDIFSTKEENGEEEVTVPELGVPDGFEELPIEIRSLTERFAHQVFHILTCTYRFEDSLNPSRPKSIRAPYPLKLFRSSSKTSITVLHLTSLHI
jgi:hypothetical protein